LLLQRREAAEERLLRARLPGGGGDLAPEDDGDSLPVRAVALEALEDVERRHVVAHHLERGLEAALGVRLAAAGLAVEIAGAVPGLRARGIAEVGAPVAGERLVGEGGARQIGGVLEDG